MDYQQTLMRFTKKMEQQNIRLHGCVLMKGTQVVAEQYWAPFTAEKPQRMYSATKSFTAIAIGRLIGEGKLRLTDKVADFFREEFDLKELHPYMEAATVRDLLMMSTPLPTESYGAHNRDWLRSFFYAKPQMPGGTVWRYASCGTYVLGAIVRRLTGMSFAEYLRPMFDRIGASKNIFCLQGPDGEEWAGSALLATTGDLAKTACLLLQGGQWEGDQLLPADFVREATSAQICNFDEADDYSKKRGYGYQIWMLPEGAFNFRGLGGQVAIGFPGRDLVFACNTDMHGNPYGYDIIFNGVWDEILPDFPIVDEAAYEAAQPKKPVPTVLEQVNGANYTLNENPMQITGFRLELEEQEGKLYYTRNGEEKCIPFGMEWDKEILFPEYYTGTKLFDEASKMRYQCTSCGRWVEPHKLFIRVYAVDLYIGNMAMSFSFKDDQVGVKMQRSAQFFFDDFNGYAGGKRIE